MVATMARPWAILYTVSSLLLVLSWKGGMLYLRTMDVNSGLAYALISPVDAIGIPPVKMCISKTLLLLTPKSECNKKASGKWPDWSSGLPLFRQQTTYYIVGLTSEIIVLIYSVSSLVFGNMWVIFIIVDQHITIQSFHLYLGICGCSMI